MIIRIGSTVAESDTVACPTQVRYLADARCRVSQNTPFTTEVARKYQLYNGLFLGLPFENVRNAGIMLPVFAAFCNDQLAEGERPADIVHTFIKDRLPELSAKERVDYIFRFMQLAERQIVLFDALEDAAFSRVHQLDGPGSIRDLIDQIQTAGKTSELRALLRDYRVRVVLTAHPTQFYPDEVLAIITDLSDALERGDTNDVYELLLQMGQTRFRNTEKPTPADEARSLLWYLESVFYKTLPTIQQELIEAAFENDPEAYELQPVLELGFWPGGDRDGNPYVTAEVTAQIGELLRKSILRLYADDMKMLARRLTFQGVSELLEEITERVERTIAPFVELPAKIEPGMEFCAEPDERQYQSAEELLADLRTMHSMLVEHHRGLYRERVEEMILKVSAFGFHFASLDLRQDSRVHGEVVEHILALLDTAGDTPYRELSTEQKINTLDEAIQSLPEPQVLIDKLTESIDKDTIRSLQVAGRIHERNGTRGMHRYIISNTQSEANVMEVRFLAACAGLPIEELELDIVPLFETVDDLHASTRVMEQLYEYPGYAQHLKHRNNKQVIMLGFSDGTKDGGYVTANWEIFKAKRRLTSQASRRGVSVTFFDGRGGPPARGGGNTHRFYRSFGKTVASRELQVTIQGQTISSKYGTADAARFNLEQLVTAGLDTNILSDHHHVLSDEENQLLDELAIIAQQAYLELKGHPQFIPYLRDRTPLRYYGKTNIASRPTQRGGSSELSLDRLRAIPFVGAWSQMKQNVPGYYGFGAALATLLEQGREADLASLYGRSLFFRTLVDNAMQSLSKTNFMLTSYLADDPQFSEFWQMIKTEAERSREMLLAVSGQHELLDSEPMTRESISLREEIVGPVLVIQQYALNALADPSVRIAEEDEATLERFVTKSLAAAVNASRNAV
jgi:phosphoenolpyruvate carboxylase